MRNKVLLLCFLAYLPWFINAQNYTFTKLPNCPVGSFLPQGFTIGNVFYIVSGDIKQSPRTMSNAVWAYNIDSNTWTQKNNFPGTAISGGSGFAINGYGYIVNGWDSSGSGSGPATLWQYDPTNDSWVTKASFPGSSRYTCTAFTLNNIAYIMGGFKPQLSDVWAYDPGANTWTHKNNFPGIPRQGPVSFVINNVAYAGMGISYDAVTGGDFALSDWYKYDPILDSWTLLNYFPGNALAGTNAMVIDNQGYLVCGAVDYSFNGVGSESNTVWQYNPGADAWSLWGMFPDTAIDDGASGTIANAGYFGLGGTNSTTYPITNMWWRLGPGTAPYSCSAGITSLYINGGERNLQATGNFAPSAQVNWNFGDSTTGTGTSLFHVFPSAGTYVVSLTVTDTSGGGCSSTTADTLVITGVSNCSVTVSNTHIGPEYSLYANATGAAPFTYTWSAFGYPAFYDATPDPLVLIDPNTPIIFCLTITDTTGCQASACDTVTYVPDSVGCETYMYISPDPNYPGLYDCYVYHTGAGPATYLWDFGDGNFSNQQYPVYTYSNPGFYNICLTITDSSNCVSTYCDSSFYAYKVGGGQMLQLSAHSGKGHTGTTTGPTAIQNTVMNSLGLSVYPNPVNDELTISLAASKIDKLIIYSTDGQKVSEFESPASNKINVKNLAAGMYFIDVKVGENYGRARFVKTN